MKRKVATALMGLTLLLAGPASDALADPDGPGPALIECANHKHVWNQQQCDSAPPFGIGRPPAGGGGGGGLLGTIGRLLGGISGGLL